MARIPAPNSAIYDATEDWKRRCLIGDGSVFGDGEIWTREHIREFTRDFIDRPDTGNRGFEEKLKDQVEQSSVGTRQLAAEMLWAMMLFPSNLRRSTKEKLVSTVWSWSAQPLVDARNRLGVLELGIGSAGMGYNNYRPWELYLMVRFASAIKASAIPERTALFTDAWRFGEWLDRLENATSRQLRHMLLHLFFPDDFERVASTTDKKRIEKAFLPSLRDDDLDELARSETALGRDRRLWLIRKKLESERPGEWLDFYETPDLKLRWNPEQETDAGESATTAADSGYSNPDGPSVWVIGAGRDARRWPEFYEGGFAAIGWSKIGDLRQYADQKAIMAALKKAYGQENDPTNNGLACYQFCREMNVGDEIYAKQGRNRVLGRGIIVGDYEYQDTGQFPNIRRVKWLEKGEWVLPPEARIPTKTLTGVNQHPKFREFMRRQLGEPRMVREELAAPYSIDNVTMEAFLPRDAVAEMLQILRRKKNLILQGSPGVGKSFLARRLAYALIGRSEEANVQVVQFHQSYAYEDFIQGYRPNGTGFALRNGVFYEFCQRAKSHPEESHVFIIDEINRGNLSKVFGELLLLIEADKRGPEFAIPLTYSMNSAFYVPGNVYIVGLMNTADRSLAMVDYALRRRFAFKTLEPAFDSDLFRSTLKARGVDGQTIRRIVTQVPAVNHHIASDTKNLGPGFAIGHSYFCPVDRVEDSARWYESVIRDEIRPLLEEYWFDEKERVRECLGLLEA